MQTYTSGTWKSDVLIQGKGVGWKQPSKWYRQVGDDYGNTSIIAKFRPSGWHKSYEYEVKFNDRNGSDNYDLTFNINRTNDTGRVLSTLNVLEMCASVEPKQCPFCSQPVTFNRKGKRWTCSSSSCQFDYTSETCKLMHREFKELNSNEFSPVHGRSLFSNFNALGTLGTTGDMDITSKFYKL